MKKICLIIVIGFSPVLYSQQLSLAPENPATVSMMQYESNPVQLYTGLPEINVPLFAVPKLKNGVDLSLQLSYHPGSVVSYDSISGNCGRGWNLFPSGAISRQISNGLSDDEVENQEGPYQFNFLDFSGKFNLQLNHAEEWEAVISENHGEYLKIVPNPLTGIITSFTIYDGLGNEFQFEQPEQIIYVKSIFDGGPGPDFRIPFKNSYQLTGINYKGATLASFEYDEFYPDESYYLAGETSIRKVLSRIDVHGHGKIEFQNENHGNWYSRFSQAVVKNLNHEVVRKFNFIYDGYFLKEVEQSDANSLQVLKHKFYYRSPRLPFGGFMLDVDNWGYVNTLRTSSYNKADRSNTRYASPTHAPTGVLEKMVLPSGGCILYQYELNTYSYLNGRALDRVSIPGTGTYTDPDFFKNLNHDNIHNFTSSPYASYTFSTGVNTHNFSVSGSPQRLYFIFEGVGYDMPPEWEPGEPGGIYYPSYRIKSGSDIIATYHSPSGSYQNEANGGMGVSHLLDPGNYSIEILTSVHSPTGNTVSISTASLNSTTLKEHRGNGIRIRRIAHFKDRDADVPHNYFLLSAPPVTPVREVAYNYNMFDDPLRSSGSISDMKTIREWDPYQPSAMNTPERRNAPIYYKNVTVTDTGNNGKTTYEFISPIDYPATTVAVEEFRFGRLKTIKTYSESGELVKSMSYDYVYNVLDSVHPKSVLLPVKIGWAKPFHIKESTFVSDHSVEKNVFFDYYNHNRQVKQLVESTSISADTLRKKFYYHTFTSPVSENLISEVKKTESFHNAELLQVQHFHFSDDWPDVFEGQMVSPSPFHRFHSFDEQKGSQGARTIMKYNVYDTKGNVLEEERPGGLKTVYVYGYDHSAIVAKIENLDYETLSSSLSTIIDQIHIKSVSGTEEELLTALSSLRNHPLLTNSMVTTYTYKPMSGVSTVTDPQGHRLTYEYDSDNKLKIIRDHKGKIISENQYNYAP